MGYLNDIISDYDAESFVDDDVFGESVTYTPVGGVAKTINANVIRAEPFDRNGVPGARRDGLTVFIRNHATLGVTSIDTGGDTIAVAPRYGGAAKTYQVKGPVQQDAGMWRLELS